MHTCRSSIKQLVTPKRFSRDGEEFVAIARHSPAIVLACRDCGTVIADFEFSELAGIEPYPAASRADLSFHPISVGDREIYLASWKFHVALLVFQTALALPLGPRPRSQAA